MNEIEKSEQHELMVGGTESIASFFLPGSVDRALKESDWSITEMVEVLTSIIRDEETKTTTNRAGESTEESIVTPKEKMSAMKMLRDMGKEAMIIGGLIQNNRLHMEKVLEDGTKIEYDSETMEVLQKGSSRLTDTMSLLERASKSDDIIDVDYKVEEEENNEPRTGHNRASDTTDGSDGPLSGRTGVIRGRSNSRDDGSGRDEQSSPVCSEEQQFSRTDARSEERQHKTTNKGSGESPTGGTKNERKRRIPLKHQRSRQSKGNGSQREPDDGNDGTVDVRKPKYPYVPGSQHLSAPGPFPAGSDPRHPGIPIRSAGDPVDPHVRTAESLTDRLNRIEQARAESSDSAGREESRPSETIKHPDESGCESVTGTS